jgi:hypothetical protein
MPGSQLPDQSTGANYNSGVGDSFVYPVGTGSSDDYPHYIRFIARRTFNTTSSARGASNGEVVLYMPPDALKTTYSQSIGDTDLGSAIQIAEGSQSMKKMENNLKETGVFNTLGNAIGGGFNVALDTSLAAAASIGAAAVGDGARQAIEKSTGQILNPHKAVVYQGPGGFRTFSYTFIMVPKSADEAKVIFNIVKFFKLRMHPGTGAAGINDISSVTLTYPDEFEIKYHVNNKVVDGSNSSTPLFKIKNCFMDTFTADYTTSGLVSFMDDDHPLTTTISMSFKETQLLTKADIDEGY